MHLETTWTDIGEVPPQFEWQQPSRGFRLSARAVDDRAVNAVVPFARFSVRFIATSRGRPWNAPGDAYEAGAPYDTPIAVKGGHEGGQFDAPAFITDASGECEIVFTAPASELRRVTVYATTGEAWTEVGRMDVDPPPPPEPSPEP